MKLGALDWQKGRVKIKLNVILEFCPNEPEKENLEMNDQENSQPQSLLDDIRLMIKDV